MFHYLVATKYVLLKYIVKIAHFLLHFLLR